MTERHLCTSTDPWAEEKSPFGLHPDATEVGRQRDGWPHGDIVTMECPNCGVRWEKELPQ